MNPRELAQGHLRAAVAALLLLGALGCGDDTSAAGTAGGADDASGGGGAGGDDSGSGSGGNASGTGGGSGAGGDATIVLSCEAGDETGLVNVVPEYLGEAPEPTPEGGQIAPGRYALTAVEIYDPNGEVDPSSDASLFERPRVVWELSSEEARQSLDSVDEQGLPIFGYVFASYNTEGTTMTNLVTCSTLPVEPGTEAVFDYTATDDVFLTFVRPESQPGALILRRYARD